MRPLSIWAVQYAWELRRFTKPTLSQVETETKKHPFIRQSIEQLVTSDNPFLPVEKREEYIEQYVDTDDENLSIELSTSSEAEKPNGTSKNATERSEQSSMNGIKSKSKNNTKTAEKKSEYDIRIGK